MTNTLRSAALLGLLAALSAHAQVNEIFSDAPLVTAPVGDALPELAGRGDVDPPSVDPRIGLFVSPVSAVMLGFVLEVEVKVASPVTVYAAGEYYGLWNGWGAQAGARTYVVKSPFNGGFIDVHARANNLYLVNLIGGGVEFGGEHRVLGSHFTVMWALGCDFGYGGWRPAPTDNTFDVVHAAMNDGASTSRASYGFTAMPKTRFMLGYSF